MEGMRVLTLTNIGETAEEDCRVTPSPMEVEMVLAKNEIRQGQAVKSTVIFFKSGQTVELYLSEYDLLTLESAVGMYGFCD